MSFYQKGTRLDRVRRDAPERNPFPADVNWIGGEVDREAAPPSSDRKTGLERVRTEWIDKREEPRTESKPQGETRITLGQDSNASRGITIGNKSPMELMQDILKGTRQGEESRPYYSKEAEQALGELLTNRLKLGSYVKRLQSQMVGLDARVVKNYQILVLLLQQVSGADVEVRQGDAGMEIRFNRGILQRQQAEIQRLQREKEERERQMKYVIEEYESIIFNFNDVIEKLVNRQEGRHKNKF